MRKRCITAALAALMTAAMGMTAFAGQWQQDSHGWRWQNDDGSYAANGWFWLDGNRDGVSECYYIAADTYMAADTKTADGYTVNKDGAWVENGAVVTKVAQNEPDDTEPEETYQDYSRESLVGSYYSEKKGSTLDLYLGMGDGLAGRYENGDSGSIRMYDFKKVNDKKYKDSRTNHVMDILEDGSLVIGNETFIQ
ncbi:MAG: hypothetical protein HFE83_08365 [Lachnospiraceae bacterium]|jgi:hypothetical protein|nr:hypothetical protein [Lachnospiraceae bacterium]